MARVAKIEWRQSSRTLVLQGWVGERKMFSITELAGTTYMVLYPRLFDRDGVRMRDEKFETCRVGKDAAIAAAQSRAQAMYEDLLSDIIAPARARSKAL